MTGRVMLVVLALGGVACGGGDDPEGFDQVDDLEAADNCEGLLTVWEGAVAAGSDDDLARYADAAMARLNCWNRLD